MKEEILNKLIQKSLSYVNSAEAFLGKEVPIYVQELLHFKTIEHLVEYFNDFFITIPIAVLFLAFIYFLFIKKDKDGKRDFEKEGLTEVMVISTFVGIILLTPLTISVFKTEHLMNAYKAYKAPRVYLVEYFKNAIKTKE